MATTTTTVNRITKPTVVPEIIAGLSSSSDLMADPVYVKKKVKENTQIAIKIPKVPRYCQVVLYYYTF